MNYHVNELWFKQQQKIIEIRSFVAADTMAFWNVVSFVDQINEVIKSSFWLNIIPKVPMIFIIFEISYIILLYTVNKSLVQTIVKMMHFACKLS